ncbi:PREDICTED: uncharacterized protein LOC109160011 [Ipomoea nil]|uniref:uncharacterized protein LOC109160011 n=1 Tax=Ipomoea nil TaxID=35883 RepID=UPI000901962C|nr:PREDICTED: uncharacterized protein LOC109160011 [Ipomoea nil]
MASAIAKTAALPSILLILSVALTVAAHHHSSDKTQLVKACSEALGPRPSARSFVTFCARDFLGHKASLLARCDKQEAAAIVVNEARKKAKVVEDFKSKIDSDKSLDKKELKDLKSCWESTNDMVKTLGKVYFDIASKKLSVDVVEENMLNKIAGAEEQCKFAAAERKSGLWADFSAKADASFKSQVVAMAFMERYRSNIKVIINN